MPDFNYGDFTQQGIENKVTLKTRLNERRYVTLDLQSDVEGPNLTISGNVHDELNNIDYPIGSAPNGNIEITENGENINVAPYATATVNVAGGGENSVRKCDITFINETGSALNAFPNAFTDMNNPIFLNLYIDEGNDNMATRITQQNLPLGVDETLTLSFIPQFIAFGQDIYAICAVFSQNMGGTTDRVNTAYEDVGGGTYIVKLTDPSSDGSIKIHIGGGQ